MLYRLDYYQIEPKSAGQLLNKYELNHVNMNLWKTTPVRVKQVPQDSTE